MESILTEKLWNYIVSNNPDLMFRLQENYSVMQYLKDKVAAIQPMIDELKAKGHPEYSIAELCMEELTADLRPSKYNFLKKVFQEEFEDIAAVLRESGTMTYELVNMIDACKEVFDVMGFSEENVDDRMLYYAITGEIDSYLRTMKTSI